MASVVTWLDFSESQQTKMREVLAQFEDKGTVDDLGLGAIRDAISNGLFPGTSIIHTRARYFLFIPWIYREAQRRKPDQVLELGRKWEKRLITALLNSEDQNGVIGKEAQASLKTLPSAIYWSALQTFEIFKLKGVTMRKFGALAARRLETTDFEGEFVGGTDPFWVEMPMHPDDFFNFDFAEMALTLEEAEWLSARIFTTKEILGRPNLLCQLVSMAQRGQQIVDTVNYVWDLQHISGLEPATSDLLFHAERFSLLARGASLQYNSMLVSLLEQKGIEAPIADYESELAEWAVDAKRIDLEGWCREVHGFWECLIDHRAVVGGPTKRFVNDLCRLVAENGVDAFSTHSEIAKVIVDRERFHKKGQARFDNGARLRDYKGNAGTRRMTFRWDLVSQIVRDISNAYGDGGTDVAAR